MMNIRPPESVPDSGYDQHDPGTGSGKVSKDLIHVLVCNEIYKRRHGGRSGNDCVLIGKRAIICAKHFEKQDKPWKN